MPNATKWLRHGHSRRLWPLEGAVDRGDQVAGQEAEQAAAVLQEVAERPEHHLRQVPPEQPLLTVRQRELQPVARLPDVADAVVAQRRVVQAAGLQEVAADLAGAEQVQGMPRQTHRPRRC